MSAREDGGPAFPAPVDVKTDWSLKDVTSGMTLRDWFAGQQLNRIASGWPNGDNMQRIAENCYAMADAMIAERSK